MEIVITEVVLSIEQTTMASADQKTKSRDGVEASNEEITLGHAIEAHATEEEATNLKMHVMEIMASRAPNDWFLDSRANIHVTIEHNLLREIRTTLSSSTMTIAKGYPSQLLVMVL